MGFPGGATVKNLLANAGDTGMRVQFLSRKDPFDEGMATHSSILAWRIPWTEEPGVLHPTGCQRVGCDWSDSKGAHYAILPAL